MNTVRALIAATAISALQLTSAVAEPSVVVSIKPLHSLVAAVMDGVGEPALIVDGAASPHAFSLKPSQASALENADIIFWIGHEFEIFLEKPIETIATDAKSVELFDAPGLIKLALREGGNFEGHDDHAGEHHDDEAHHSEGDDHGHHADHQEGDEKHHADHHDDDKKHDDHHDDGDMEADDHHHGESEKDTHIWLDPQNAMAMVGTIADTLATADPENAKRYRTNADATLKKIDAQMLEIQDELNPVKDRGFVVFHDAYHYFENRFGLEASASITVNPETKPGAERVREIREKIAELGAICVFSEPQFEPSIVDVITANSAARTAVLDPLGATLENGPELYYELTKNMAGSFRQCLSEEG